MYDSIIPYIPIIDPGVLLTILMDAKNNLEIIDGVTPSIDEYITEVMARHTAYEVGEWAKAVAENYPNYYKRKEKKGDEEIW